MIATRDKLINGHTYSVTQFPARHAFMLKARLAKLLGPALAEILASLNGVSKESILSADIDLSAISAALNKLLGAVDEQSTMDLILKLLSCTRMDGKEITEQLFDIEFAGNLSDVYKVLAFVIEVNYGDFFGSNGIGNLIGRKLSSQ